jgi:Zn-dependent protease
MGNFNSPEFFVRFAEQLVIIFVAIGLHEYAHCKFADLAGDPTPRYYGRVTLNLFKHFDPVGAFMIVVTSFLGFGIGWGKPAPMNPEKMHNPRWDFFVAVIAGPLCNVAQATIYLIILKLCIVTGVQIPQALATFLLLGSILNLMLAFFNLIPLGPLDGHWLLGLLMPEKARLAWFKFNRVYGSMLLFGIIIFGQVNGRNGGTSLLDPIIFQPAVNIVFALLGKGIHTLG